MVLGCAADICSASCAGTELSVRTVAACAVRAIASGAVRTVADVALGSRAERTVVAYVAAAAVEIAKRTVAAHTVAVIAPLISVAHTKSRTAVRMSPVAASTIPTVSAIHAPTVSAAINSVEVWTSEVKIVSVRIAGVNAEVPVASCPVDRTVEVSGIAESPVLPIEENIAEVEIAIAPVSAIKVIYSVYTHKVVEINLIGCLVLVLCEIQFVSHLIGKEQSFLASLFITHCRC